jgi:adenosine deaminase
VRLALVAALLIAGISARPAIAAEGDSARAARLFESVRAQPARLRVFLRAMPKGGDLHNHMAGSVYAEDLIDEAGKAGFCVAADGSAILPPPCTAPGKVAAVGLPTRDPVLYGALIDRLSMRARVAGGGSGWSDHDHFFDTFGRFAAIAGHAPGRVLAEVRTLAAGDNVTYVETQTNPPAMGGAAALATARRVPADDPAAAFALLAPDMPGLVAKGRGETDAMERDAARRLGCDRPSPPAACGVTVRYQAVAIRNLSPQVVFAQLHYAFALADADPRYVGVNIVAPEDGPVALTDYDRHMAMLRYLGRRYPNVPMSLHAGELARGLVPADALRDHIAKAVDAGARRIGHGVDISHEADAPQLLARMARDRIAVEINLSSNDLILGVRGADHPLALYRAAGVPTVLSTDDEGVARSDMTNEYVRAATEQRLGYADLKAMARASIRYSFLVGDSLWRSDAVGTPGPACRAVDLTREEPAGECGRLIASSEKAREEWRLERAFARFEAGIGSDPF